MLDGGCSHGALPALAGRTETKVDVIVVEHSDEAKMRAFAERMRAAELAGGPGVAGSTVA